MTTVSFFLLQLKEKMCFYLSFTPFSDLNVLDWSRSNQLAIALGATVYLWNSETGSAVELLELGDEDDGSCVCSLSFAEKGKYLAVGTHNGDIQVSF